MTIDKILTVGEMIATFGVPYSNLVTTSVHQHGISQHALRTKFGQYPLPERQYGYKRYGYSLSDLVATRYANSICAVDLGFQARLVNSGMAAIDTALRVAMARMGGAGGIYHATRLYPETPKLLREYGALAGCELMGIDRSDTVEDIIASTHNEEVTPPDCSLIEGDILFFETVGNHPSMPVLPLEEILLLFWLVPITLIVDNTIPSFFTINPIEIYELVRGRWGGDPKLTMVVVESLTKYYRAGEDSEVTAGIIVAPDDFIVECDKVIARTGAYLQAPCLEELPFNPTEALQRTVGAASQNALTVASGLRALDTVEWVAYPHHAAFPQGAGAVMFFAPKWDITYGLREYFGYETGSFGHAKTTWLPWGALVPGDYPKSTIRLSCGWSESAGDILSSLVDAFPLSLIGGI